MSSTEAAGLRAGAAERGISSPWDDRDGFAAVLKAIVEPNRLRILMLLTEAGTMSVRELTEHMDVMQPTVSHHLGILREGGLVTDERQGVWRIYSVNREALITLSEGVASLVKVPKKARRR